MNTIARKNDWISDVYNAAKGGRVECIISYGRAT